MEKVIAFAGNPNSGKSTLFNELSGARQYVGNWPGVTVEKKEAYLKADTSIKLVDLPGIYSLSPYTAEERIARDYLINEKVDLLLAVIDASNLERNLYLLTQLLEMGLPVVVALNMMDVLEKQQCVVEVEKLAHKLGVPVFPIVAVKGQGTKDLAQELALMLQSDLPVAPVLSFSPEIESVLTQISAALKPEIAQRLRRKTSLRIFEGEAELRQQALEEANSAPITALIQDFETAADDTSEGIMANARYECIEKLLADVRCQKKGSVRLSSTDKVDKIVTSRWLGLPIFLLIMFAVYWFSTFGGGLGDWITSWTNDILVGEVIQGNIGDFLASKDVAPFLQGLLVDGVVGGVGAILGFLPQMAILFLCLSFLEQIGYMARAAFLLDRLFRRFGLSGKSFIPILISSGCAVPGIMATRTIENERDRRMTVMLAPMIPCGAKLPVIALIGGALFSEHWWFAPSAYFICIGAIVISGIILKKLPYFSGDPAPFVMELPPYHWPSLKNLSRQIWERLRSFIVKAGTIILLSSIVIYVFTNLNWRLQMVEENAESIFASLAKLLTPVFAPLGWPFWEAVVGTIAGLVAKENLLSSMAVLFPIASEAAAEIVDESRPLWPHVQALFSQTGAAAGLSWLVFNLLCIPCFAALGSTRREMASAKWTWLTIAFQLGSAYVFSFLIYQLGAYLGGGYSFGLGTAVAVVVLVALICLLFWPQRQVKKAEKG